jgi:hypothetical protein
MGEGPNFLLAVPAPISLCPLQFQGLLLRGSLGRDGEIFGQPLRGVVAAVGLPPPQPGFQWVRPSIDEDPNRQRPSTRKGFQRSTSMTPQVGVQMTRGVHSQVQEQDVVRADPTASWRSVPQVSDAEGKSDRARASAAGAVHMLISIPPKYTVSQSGRRY